MAIGLAKSPSCPIDLEFPKTALPSGAPAAMSLSLRIAASEARALDD
jgi:hypothetical protein